VAASRLLVEGAAGLPFAPRLREPRGAHDHAGQRDARTQFIEPLGGQCHDLSPLPLTQGEVETSLWTVQLKLSFTSALASVMSISEPWRAFSAAITLPMSLIEMAPVSALIAAIAARVSSSLSIWGRNSSITASSARSVSASSSRPPST